jgi:dipeptidase E
MKLFLTSSTITENLVKDFEQLINKPINNLKVAFIPDAADGIPYEKDNSWVETERQFLIDNYNWDITTFSLKEPNPENLLSLYNYDVIFVNGGFSGYLAKMMRQSGFEKILPELLAQGIVYVGSSAGSMVMSDLQDASSWYLREPEPETIDIPGLGYIDFQIYPHIEDNEIEDIKINCKKGILYYLLRDGTAISINDDKITLCGNGIEIVNPK